MSTSAEVSPWWSVSGKESEIYGRYGQRLNALVRARLGSKVRRRIDAEDVTQSTFRSFFVRAADGQYQFQHSSELWKLLAAMAINKTRKQLERHRAARRDVMCEHQSQAPQQAFPDAAPTASTVLLAQEQLQLAIANLTSDQRAVLEGVLEGWSSQQMADSLGKSERSIRRALLQLRELLQHNIHNEFERTESADSLTPLAYDDYVLEQLIGAGGMGKVFRARTKVTGEIVAMKALHKSRQTDPWAVGRFVQEAQILQGLSHPHIVAVRGLGRFPSGGHFMVQELVEGGDLESRLSSGPLPFDSAMALFRQIVEATAHAHRQGVVHCDLKPANVLVGADDHVVVTDFGFACLLHTAASSKAIGGTLGYLAPELLLPGARPTARADVYSLGVLLQTMLTGSVARPLGNLLRGEHDKRLKPVLRRALAENPPHRFADAIEMLRALVAIA